MSEPGEAAETAETVLDPGREHWRVVTEIDEVRGSSRRTPEAEIETLVDEGRSPREQRPWTELPPGLAARYQLVRRLNHPAGVRGAEAELYQIRELAGERRTRLLKVYRAGRTPDERIWPILRQLTTQHVVGLVETGHAAARAYEVQEYLTGGDLIALRNRNRAGLEEESLRTVVEHVAIALGELHDNGVVHRDIKPGNLMLRSGSGLDVVIVDTGIATTSIAGEPLRAAPATPRYAPPEWDAGDTGYADPSADWWSFGVTLLELATGQPFFDDVSDAAVRRHVRTRIVDVPVQSERVRHLCRNLLLPEPELRWDSRDVFAWTRGRQVPPRGPSRADARAGSTARPFEFGHESYDRPDLLASGLAQEWEAAASALFGGSSEHLTRLARWLDQFPGRGEDVAEVRALAGAGEPPDVRLLRLLHVLDPARQPSYRHELITRRRLPAFASRALRDPGVERAVVEDLWRHRLLSLLATSGSDGEWGTGLDTADLDWRAEHGRWKAVTAGVGDQAARNRLGALGRDEVRAACLYAATMPDSEQRQLEHELRSAAEALPARVPWFDALVVRGQTALELVTAGLLLRVARQQARDARERRQARQARQRWERENADLAEWSRRQARLPALGWAVAGTALVAGLWLVLITAGDLAPIASDRAVLEGWVAAVPSAGVVLATEAVLATTIGSRYPTPYSLPAAGLIALRPVAARARGHGAAAGIVLLAVLAAIGLVAAVLPVAIPVATAMAVLWWAVRRYGAWRDEERQEAEAEANEDSDAPAGEQRDVPEHAQRAG